MKISGEELHKIRDSLKQAFPAASRRLDLVVADADIGIDFAEYPGPYENRIQTLLQDAAGQYRLPKLLKTAVAAAPDNPELAEIAEFVARYFVFLPRFLPGEEKEKALGDAERVLFKNLGFQNVRQWLEKLDRLTRVVCRIEPQPRCEGIGGYGTGFLVGPDVILTNDHVASGYADQPGFWGNPERAARVKVRFDCEYTAEGNITLGKEYKLATDFQILRSPVDQLDFALLKLDSSTCRPNEDIVGGKPRGFAVPIAHTFEESEPLLILQHPQAEPMKLALGSLTPKKQWPENRIEYKVNTDQGSSGSPCLTQRLDVGALHHWGSAASNRGVLMSALLAFFNKPENQRQLEKAGLGRLIGGGESMIPTVPGPLPTAPQADVAEEGGKGKGHESSVQQPSSFSSTPAQPEHQREDRGAAPPAHQHPSLVPFFQAWHRLAIRWFAGSGVVFLLVVLLSLFGNVYKGQLPEFWGWVLWRVMPALVLILGGYLLASLTPERSGMVVVRREFSSIACWVAVVYLVLLLLTLLGQPFARQFASEDARAVDVLKNSDWWLIPVEILVLIALLPALAPLVKRQEKEAGRSDSSTARGPQGGATVTEGAGRTPLPGSIVKDLQDALCDAFTEDELEQMLRLEMDAGLFAIVGHGKPLPTVTFNLIQAAQRDGRLAELVQAMARTRPGNPLVKAFCQKYGKRFNL
jgi:V8-like Glu-specific endopeptidase